MSGVWMTKRDTFLTKGEYTQLVYAACSPTRPGLLDAEDLLILSPTIFKPEVLYTGKQVSNTQNDHIVCCCGSNGSESQSCC